MIVVSFAAALGFLLVNIVDPYSGAVAATNIQPTAARFSHEQTQTLVVNADYENSVSRDSYTVKEKPKPKPKPKPMPAPEPQAPSQQSFSAPSVVPNPGSAQAYAKSVLAARGFGDSEFQCLVSLWNRESGWRVNASNSSSGAYGIPQALPGSKMASAGPNWQTNAQTQVDWGLGYVIGRYGSPCSAWGHSNSYGWY